VQLVRGLLAAAAAAILVAAPSVASAHQAAMSSFDARTDGGDVVVSLLIDATSVIDLVARGGGATIADKATIPAHEAAVLAYLDARFTVGMGDGRCPRVKPTRIRFDAGRDKVVIDARYRCGAPTTVSFTSTLFHDEDIPHQVIGTVRHFAALERYFFTRGEQTARMDLRSVPAPPPGTVGSRQFRMATPPPGVNPFAAPPPGAPSPSPSPSPSLSPSADPSLAPPPPPAPALPVDAPPARRLDTGLGTFFIEGIQHILGGLDHLLFLVSLLLAVDGWRRFALVVTSFTIAHSVTLALGALELVVVSPRLVEPLIAASIVYVAVENIVRRAPRARIAVTFGFGLVHGLGFGGALRDLGLTASELWRPLLGFNLGVETGQLMVVAPLLPLVLWLDRKPELSRKVRIVAGVAVGVLALVWLVQRLRG
jgi:hydrogenase/urease accessory protein HupE